MPLFAALFAIGLFFGLIDPMLARIWTAPSLPDVPRVRREDRWNLADKVRQIAHSGPETRLELTSAEINALLARWSPPPSRGFVLTRASLLPDTDRALIILQGSGFWMRTLTFTIEIVAIAPGASVFRVHRLTVNALEFAEPEQDWTASLILDYLEAWISRALDWSVEALNGGRLRAVFTNTMVTLSGDLLAFPPIQEFVEAATRSPAEREPPASAPVPAP